VLPEDDGGDLAEQRSFGGLIFVMDEGTGMIDKKGEEMVI
jgi:hypothetical protein